MDERIQDLTSTARDHERSLAFFVWKQAKSYGVDLGTQDIEDILSESYLIALTKLRNDHSLVVSNYYAWLTRIVFLNMLNTFKKQVQRKMKLSDTDLQEIMDVNLVMETLDNVVHRKMLNEKIGELLTQEEKAIIDRGIEGYLSREIAEELGISSDAVRKIKSRAIQKIKKILR
jgi:RNA polymerase sigma factor (sigma-70 family)